MEAKAVKLNKQKAAEEAEEENATEKELKQLHAKPTSLPEDSPACWKAVANQTVRTYITLIVEPSTQQGVTTSIRQWQTTEVISRVTVP